MINCPTDLTAWDIQRTNRAYESGETTPTIIIEEHLERIAELNPVLNAFIFVELETSRKEALASTLRFKERKHRSLLDGVPIALKDNIDVAGTLTTNGSSKARQVDADAVVTSRLREAGAVILGKLNMDEGALGATTNNPHHGPTYNPWREGYSAGGSSGGSAAAVSAGLVMAALGTDTLGSVRIPAAYCGIIGFKPTKNLIDMSGIMPLFPTLDHVGPLCRSTEDIIAIMPVLTDTYVAETLSSSPFFSRIGVVDKLPPHICDESVLEAYKKNIHELSATCESTVFVSLEGIDFQLLRRHALIAIEAEAAKALAPTWNTPPYAYSRNFREMLAFGRGAKPTRVRSALQAMNETGELIRSLFSEIDFLVMPSTPQLAHALDTPTSGNQGDLTGLANMAGCPAIVIPTGLASSGLPTSLQILAAPGRDYELLNWAQRIASTWKPIFPPL